MTYCGVGNFVPLTFVLKHKYQSFQQTKIYHTSIFKILLSGMGNFVPMEFVLNLKYQRCLQQRNS
jgi:hypothetical protein